MVQSKKPNMSAVGKFLHICFLNWIKQAREDSRICPRMICNKQYTILEGHDDGNRFLIKNFEILKRR